MIVYSKELIVHPPLYAKGSSGQRNGKITVLQSDNIPVEKLQKIIHFYANNQWREVSLLSEDGNCIDKSQRLWGFHIKDVIFFWWESKTNTIYYKLETSGTPELLAYWLLHIALPMILTVEEEYIFLHAGAVEVQGKPILFLAESFGGKSTMTNFFIGQGHAMISDDKVGTFEKDGLFFAVPSYPYQRPYRKPEDMGIYIENFATESKPIHAFYALEQADKDADIEIDEMTGMEKFYVLRLSSQFNLSFQKKERFEDLMRISNSVNMFRIKVPWDMDRLPEVYKAIVKHTEEI